MGILDDAIKEHLELKRAHGAPEDLIKEKEAEAFGPIRQGAAPAPAEAEVDEVDPETALYEDAATEYEPMPEPESVAPAEPAAAPEPEHEHEHEQHHAVAEDPYVVHPGDEPVPDPHSHDEPVGSDPAYREDTAIFAEAPAPPAPVHHPEEPHPALHEHDHLRGEEHAPEPVFRAEPPAAAPEPAAPAPEPELASDPVPEPELASDPVPEPEPAPAPEPEPETAPAATAPIPDTEAEVELAEEDVLEETPEFLQDAPEHDRLWFEQRPPRDFDFGE